MTSSTLDVQLHSPRKYSSIEEMQEAREAAGWTAQYRQLQAGPLSTTAYSREIADISLLDEFASRSIEVAGTAPAGCTTVLAPNRGGQLWANGLTIRHGDLLVLDTESPLHCVTSDNCRVLSMHLPVGIEEGTARASNVGLVRAYKGPRKVQPGARETAALRQIMIRAIHQRESNGHGRHVELAGLLKDRVAKIFESCAAPEIRARRLGATESHRVINRAREYIDENIDQPISMTDLACHVGGSIRKIERVFRNQIGMSPSRYILAIRLASVRDTLLVADTDAKRVSDVAMDFGFGHLGRFAAAYYSHFGELPSATLRS